jgi:hypothetical protein
VSRNRGRVAVPGHLVAHAVAAATARLARRHPSIEHDVVHSAVYQAAVELVSTVTDPDRLAPLLERRGHARLLAMTGAPLAISRSPRPQAWHRPPRA